MYEALALSGTALHFPIARLIAPGFHIEITITTIIT
jgi:hypothetical protein